MRAKGHAFVARSSRDHVFAVHLTNNHPALHKPVVETLFFTSSASVMKVSWKFSNKQEGGGSNQSRWQRAEEQVPRTDRSTIKSLPQ